ncbi:MAG TPA: CoA-binding protein [Terriglobales bacterium]|nr:CoA-binding protein [Terriglobales bacterium]
MSADDSTVKKLLDMKTIAVVGLSKDQSKPSHDVARYLLEHGYKVVPINPTVDNVLGLKSYGSLSELPDELKQTVDVVDIFRRSEDVPPIVDEAIKLHSIGGRPAAIWMQLGIVNEEAARKVRASGMDVVMDRCMKIEHNKFRSQT